MEGGGFEPPKADAGRFTVCSLWPLGHPSMDSFSCVIRGFVVPSRAGGGTRTRDLLITSQVLYRLSYASEFSLVSVAYGRVGATGLVYRGAGSASQSARSENPARLVEIPDARRLASALVRASPPYMRRRDRVATGPVRSDMGVETGRRSYGELEGSSLLLARRARERLARARRAERWARAGVGVSRVCGGSGRRPERRVARERASGMRAGETSVRSWAGGARPYPPWRGSPGAGSRGSCCPRSRRW